MPHKKIDRGPCERCGKPRISKHLNVRFCSRACAVPLKREKPPRLTTEQRFWRKVKKDGPVPVHVPSLGPCWLWMGSTTGKEGFEYGRFWDGERLVLSHRYAWELVNGPIPDGRMSLHRCDRTLCIRESHLFTGDAADNAADCVSKGRYNHDRRWYTGSRVLSANAIADIRSSYIPRVVTYKSLAEKHGVSTMTVLHIVKRNCKY